MEVESAIDVYKYSRLGPACKRGKPLQQLHFPMHHKYLLSGEHTTSRVLCILHHWPCAFCLNSLARAADPEDTPAFIRVCVLSGDIKGSCLACCPVSQQKVSRMGVAMIGCGVIASFHLDAKMGPVACFSQNIT